MINKQLQFEQNDKLLVEQIEHLQTQVTACWKLLDRTVTSGGLNYAISILPWIDSILAEHGRNEKDYEVFFWISHVKLIRNRLIKDLDAFMKDFRAIQYYHWHKPMNSFAKRKFLALEAEILAYALDLVDESDSRLRGNIISRLRSYYQILMHGIDAIKSAKLPQVCFLLERALGIIESRLPVLPDNRQPVDKELIEASGENCIHIGHDFLEKTTQQIQSRSSQVK